MAAKSRSILVVDDEDDIRVLLKIWLSEAGHHVVSVAGTKEALQELKSRSFDLVVTDILMPGGDGLDLITGLKAKQPAIRVLAISGGGRYLEGENCLKLARGWGAHAGLIKPFDRGQLLAAIDQAFVPVPGP